MRVRVATPPPLSELLFHLGGREGGAHPPPKRLLQFLGNSEAQVVVVVIGHNLRNSSEAQNNQGMRLSIIITIISGKRTRFATSQDIHKISFYFAECDVGLRRIKTDLLTNALKVLFHPLPSNLTCMPSGTLPSEPSPSGHCVAGRRSTLTTALV